MVDPPETCDPPGAPQPPTNSLCREDCTYCGDGILQPGESCDDGNGASGCRTDYPQKPIDACLSSCQRPICEDPAKILLKDVKLDSVQVHARLIADKTVGFESQPFEFTILRRLCSHDPTMTCGSDAECEAVASGSICTDQNEASVVFHGALPGGIPVSKPGRWRHSDVTRKALGGFTSIKIQAKVEPAHCVGGANEDRECYLDGDDCPGGSCIGYYSFQLKAYGTIERAVTDMQTRITVGQDRWVVRGLWQHNTLSWKLNQKSPLLEPWP